MTRISVASAHHPSQSHFLEVVHSYHRGTITEWSGTGVTVGCCLIEPVITGLLLREWGKHLKDDGLPVLD